MIRCFRIIIVVLAVSAASACGPRGPGDQAVRLEVVGAEVQETDDAVVLDAQLRYQFGDAVLEAMRHGVPVTLLIEARIVNRSSRPWLEVVLQTQRLYRLDYHALSGQYLLEDISSGEQTIYPNHLALQDAMARPPGLRLVDDLTLPAGQLQGSIRARIHIEDLPPAMRLMAYLSPEWRLSSEWYVWKLES